MSFLGYMISHNQVEMDPEKVQVLAEWPTSRKEVQCFLGFSNFYREFIRNCSSVASPLSALTSPKVSLQWSQPCEGAFQLLKKLFTTAPVLILPSADQQFILEVDASSSGVGSVLSQRSGTDNSAVLFCPEGYPRRGETTRWGTRSCWL